MLLSQKLHTEPVQRLKCNTYMPPRYLGIAEQVSKNNGAAYARIFYQLIYEPSYCNFPESRKKKILKLFFLFICRLQIIFVLLKKMNIFLGSVCVFLRVTLLKVIVYAGKLLNI